MSNFKYPCHCHTSEIYPMQTLPLSIIFAYFQGKILKHKAFFLMKISKPVRPPPPFLIGLNQSFELTVRQNFGTLHFWHFPFQNISAKENLFQTWYICGWVIHFVVYGRSHSSLADFCARKKRQMSPARALIHHFSGSTTSLKGVGAKNTRFSNVASNDNLVKNKHNH